MKCSLGGALVLGCEGAPDPRAPQAEGGAEERSEGAAVLPEGDDPVGGEASLGEQGENGAGVLGILSVIAELVVQERVDEGARRMGGVIVNQDDL